MADAYGYLDVVRYYPQIYLSVVLEGHPPQKGKAIVRLKRFSVCVVVVCTAALACGCSPCRWTAQSPPPYRFLFAVGAQAATGQPNSPCDISVASDGSVYAADMDNQRVQAFGTAYPSTWHGEHYDNEWLTGAPVLIRQDAELNFVAYLPLVLRDYPLSSIANGGFEAGDLRGWEQGGTLDRRVVTGTDGIHSGGYALLLGRPEADPCDPPVGQAWVEQQFLVSASGSPVLSLWHRMFTYDRNTNLDDGIDHLDVLLNGQRVVRVANRSGPVRCTPPAYDLGWQEVTYDLSQYAGQQVTLRIVLANTDRWYNTWAFVDDVAVVQ